MVAQMLTHPLLDLLGSNHLRALISGGYEAGDNLAISLIRYTDNRDIKNTRVGQEAILDFKGMYVLATSDNQILNTAGYRNVSIFRYRCFVSSLLQEIVPGY
jgi:hypothetical protein